MNSKYPKHKNRLVELSILVCIILSSCEPAPIPPVPPVRFDNVTFDKNHPYFSTNGTMTNAVDSAIAHPISDQIDFTFIVPTSSFILPGFFDPVARSQTWSSMNDFYMPWLSNGVETRFYKPDGAHPIDFTSACADEKKIGQYFEGGGLHLVHQGIYPDGSCIGGYFSSPDTNYSQTVLSYAPVYGFKHTLTGKRGLIKVDYVWNTLYDENPNADFTTVVDIIIEH